MPQPTPATEAQKAEIARILDGYSILARERKENADILDKGVEAILGRLQRDQQEKKPNVRAVQAAVVRDGIDEENRIVQVSFSSEEPYLRYYGYEILGHNEDEIRRTRIDDSAAVLVGHHWGGWDAPTDSQVGVVDRVEFRDGRGYAWLRFGRSQLAQDIFQDMVDGIRKHISVGYFVHDMVLVEQTEDGTPNVYRVSDWEPYEISIVPVPADITVGFGKGLSRSLELFKSEATTQKEAPMTTETHTPAAPARDVDLEVNTAREEERNEIAERNKRLAAIGNEFDATDLALKCIGDGSSVEELQRMIMRRDGEIKPAAPPTIGMERDDVERYSIMNVMRYLADESPRNRNAAAYELECAEEAAKTEKRKDVKGVPVPFDLFQSPHVRGGSRLVPQRRDYNVGTPAEGGNLVATELVGPLIRRFESILALKQVGAQIYTGLSGNIAMPRQNGGVAYYWIGENGAPTESSATFDQITMTPKTIAAMSDMSRLNLIQSSLDLEALAWDTLLIALAQGIDVTGISSDGTNGTPLGLLNQPGVQSVASGGTVDRSHLISMYKAVITAKAMGNFQWLTNGSVQAELMDTPIAPGSDRFVWNENSAVGPLLAKPAVTSENVPSDLGAGSDRSALIGGMFSEYAIGMFGGLDLMRDPFTKSDTGGLRIVAFQSMDQIVKRPEALVVSTDILPTL